MIATAHARAGQPPLLNIDLHIAAGLMRVLQVLIFCTMTLALSALPRPAGL